MKVYKKLDMYLSPPKNYANFTYNDRFKEALTSLTLKPQKIFHLIRLSYMIGISYMLFPISLILKKLGYRFIDIDLDQIGSVIFLDLLIREDKITCKTHPRKMLVLFSNYQFGNNYILDLYRNHVTFIRSPLLKFLLSPFFVSDVFYHG